MIEIYTVPVTPFLQNCRIIVCKASNQAAIVDPGGDKEKIIAKLTALEVKVEKIILTHGHLDHVGATMDLKQHYNIPVVGPHRDEQFWFDALPEQAKMFGFNYLDPFLPDEWLVDGEQVTVGSVSFKVFHCPGHTPGHVVFYEPNTNVVLVGDVLFKGSIGRTDFPRGDANQLVSSIKQKLFTLPDETSVLSGHGDNTTIGHEKASNPFLSGRFG
ncbi:Hypothetical metal-binding enzyme, YcbL homolog [Pseudoalteromonas luteoviolacea B = ATCC 29581]|nr:Hypothetical metal-binding enzyme, YcbL homolog [Pseudoalteromonas luteoviolacea B = ATCC 29581]